MLTDYSKHVEAKLNFFLADTEPHIAGIIMLACYDHIFDLVKRLQCLNKLKPIYGDTEASSQKCITVIEC